MASQKYVAKRQALVLQVRRLPLAVFQLYHYVLYFFLRETCLFRVSPSFGGTWSCAASARRACTTWAERCTSWASHIWPYITTRRHLNCPCRRWRFVDCVRDTRFLCHECSGRCGTLTRCGGGSAGPARRSGGPEERDRLQPVPHLPDQRECGDGPADH